LGRWLSRLDKWDFQRFWREHARLDIILGRVQEFAPYIFVLLLIIIMVSNKSFMGSGYLNLGDIAFPFLPRKAMFDTLYTWTYSNLGAQNTAISLLPYYAFIFLLASLQIPLVVVTRLVLVIPLLLVGFSTIFLGKALFDTRFSSIACAASAVFLLVSPALSFLTEPKFMFAFGGTILFLGFLIRGLRYGHHRKYAFLAALSSVLMSMQPHVLALSAILIVIFLLVYTPLCSSTRALVVRCSFIVGTLSMSVLFNLYWIIPEGFVYLANPGAIQAVYGEQNVRPWGLPYTSLFWRLRLLFFSNTLTELPAVIIIQYAIVAFGLSYIILELLRRRRPKTEPIPFFVLFLVFLTLYQGESSPLYMFLWDHFSLFQVFRNASYFVLPISLVFSVLIGFSLEALLQLIDEQRTKLPHTRKIARALILTLFISMIAAYGIPGPLLYRAPIDQSLEHRSDMNIPPEYFNLPSMLGNSSDSQFRLLVLPWQGAGNINFTWFPHFLTPDITESFSPIPTVIGGILGGPPKVEELVYAINVNVDVAVERMGRVGIKYVLLHHDENGVEQIEEKLRKSLDSSTYFSQIATYPSFSLYKLDDRYVLPKIYVIEQTALMGKFEGYKILNFKDGYFLSANLSSLALVPPFTISLWVNQMAGTTKGAYILSSSSIQPGRNEPAFMFLTDVATVGQSQFLVASPSGYVYINKFLKLGQFQHLVGVVYNSSIAYYVDGLLIANVTLGASPVYDSPPAVYLGWNPIQLKLQPQTLLFNGYIHNVQFYKSALSPYQVYTLFQRSIMGSPIEEAIPILHWPLNSTPNEMINGSLKGGRWFGTVKTDNLSDHLDLLHFLPSFSVSTVKPIAYDTLSPVYFSGTLNFGKQTLIFNEQFNTLWELRVGDKVVENHQIADEFANAWSFTSEKNDTFSIRLVHSDSTFFVFVSIGLMALMPLLLWRLPPFILLVYQRINNTKKGKKLLGGLSSFLSLVHRRIGTGNMVVVLTIIIASLLVYGGLTFKPNTFLIWSDTPFEFFADEASSKILNSWEIDNFGFPSIYRGSIVWFGLEWLLLKFLPLVITNRILFLLPLFFRGFSMYYLLSTFIRKNDSVSTFCKLIPSIFFIAIPLDVYAFWTNGFALAFMPLVMAFFIRGAFADRKTIYIGLGALSSVFLFTHPVLTAFTFLILLIFMLLLITESRKRVPLLSYFLKFLVLVGLFNMLTLVPLLLAQQNLASYLGSISEVLTEANLAASAYFNRLIYVSRLLTAQPSLPYFSSPLVVLLGFFMVVYCYTSVFYIRSRDGMRIFAEWLTISSLLITLFATGVAYPVSGSVYLFFYRRIPGLFSNVAYWLYPLSVLYACLIGLTTYLIAEYIRSLNLKSRRVTVLLRKYLAVSIIGIAVVSVVAYNGAVYTNAELGFRGIEATTIPEDYFQLRDLLNTKNANDFWMLVYPEVDHFVRPTWFDQSFHILDIVDKFAPVPTIVWRVSYSPSKLMQRALLDLDKGETHDALRVLGILSVKYIFVHKDIPGINYSGAARTLSSSSQITLVKDSENYMLFEIDESIVVPMIFAVSTTDINATGYITNITNPRTAIRGYSKGPEEYDIRIPADKEVIVVLNKAYSSDWMLSGDQLQSEQMLINGFVNGWYVKSTEETVVHVTLESNVWISLGVSLSIVSMISFAVIIARRRFTNKLEKALRRLRAPRPLKNKDQPPDPEI